MNNGILKLRLAALNAMIDARRAALADGFDDVVQYLDERIYIQQRRVNAARVPDFSTPENAQFATPKNRLHNGIKVGAR